MNPEHFKRFLESLSASCGGEDGGSCYIRLYRKLVGLSAMKGIRDPANAADETINRAAMKIAEGVPVPDVGNYCMGIARNVIKEILRSQQRESQAFLRFLACLDDDAGEEVARIDQTLRPCFELLADDEKKLLVAYCEVMRGRIRAEHRRELAVSMNTTVQALRMRVNRLREVLTECVEKRSNDA